MARKNPDPLPEPSLELVVSRADAEAKIRDRIEKGKELKSRPIVSWEHLEATRHEYYKWSAYNEELLRRLFTNDKLAQEYSGFLGIAVAGGPPPTLQQEVVDFHESITDSIHRLESIKERLELIPESRAVAALPKASPASLRLGRKAFVVHGHDEGARESVARFLERCGVEPVILHEQASGGRTIIEKLEHYADVDFAVVLLTPDDMGAVASAKDRLSPRARQNVVLELGYFVGKLGRSRVCALHKGSVELPSDILGVVYVSLDEGGAWRVLLAKELRQAGFNVDLNDAL